MINPPNPDQAEETVGATHDDPIPTRGYRMLPTVGLGGSAGAIRALQAFLRAVPPASGMAYVVVLHLSPDHDSHLDRILQAWTPMPVLQVSEPVEVEADHVYVIPPGHALEMNEGQLRLGPLVHQRGRHIAIDLFFRSLAEWYGPHAAAIVLSGGDGDGAIGIQRIKERGGLTVAQDPDEAEVSSMPRSAIATGMVDWILPGAEMPARLVEYRRLEARLVLPPEDGPQPASAAPAKVDGPEAALRDVLGYLRARTGRDFTYYKRATILRRIARRMQVNSTADLKDYLACMRTRPGEVGALLQDLLISVTNFFRDAHCFEAVEAALPALFAGKGGADRVRVWVAACASGEEAYSLSMLLHEHAGTLDDPPLIQVFATDLDAQAIQAARAGFYPASIETDVSPDRLRRFFTREHAGYRIRRELRESVLFAVHDLLKDSPFSRLDLVACRNLMIYLTREAQAQALQTFHFALRQGGLLFLGSSETVEEGSRYFALHDKKARLYDRRRTTDHAPLPVVSGPGSLELWLRSREVGKPGPTPLSGVAAEWPMTTETPPRAVRADDAGATPWPQFHFRLLEQFAPPSLVIDGDHQIVHLSPRAGAFLTQTGGEPTTDLLRLVDPELRIELRAALFRATQNRVPAEVATRSVEVDGQRRDLTIRVLPALDAAGEFMLVVFDARERVAAVPAIVAESTAPAEIVEQLDREVGHAKKQLRETVEQYEASTEELKASNEELQAMNEELRSATEELETGREELQSINEEMSSVNQELKLKVDELGGANSDMRNLMDATEIPTVFLDRELRINRYTPAAVEVFNLIGSDIGRPLTDLRTEIDFPTLAEDALRVLERLVPVEREVSRAGRHWYEARLRPYRTIDDRIAGLVLTLVDITERRAAVTALRQSEERLRLVVENASEYAIFSFDPERRITSWNAGAERLLGYRENETLGQSADVIFTQEDIDADVPAREAGLALAVGRAADDRFHRRKDGSRFWASGVTMPMREAAGAVVGFVKVLRDQTEARNAQEALEQSRTELLEAWHEAEGARRESDLQKEHLASLFTQAPAPICILRGHEYRVEFVNPHMCEMWGCRPEDVVGKPVFDAVPSVRGTVIKELLDGVMETGLARTGKEIPARIDRRGRGEPEEAHLNFTYAPLRDIAGRIDGVLAMAADVTDEVRAREQMSELHEAEQAASRAKDDFLAMLGHELRNPLAPLRTSLHLIRQHMPPSTADPLLDIVERQAANLTRIVDDLLDAARVTEGKIGLRLETIDMVESVQHALDAAREFLDSQGHQVVVHLSKRPLRLRADPVRLEQIVLNLLNNAGKYTPVGGRVEVTVKRVGRMAELRVADSGIGIPEDLQPRLFQIFQQGNRDLAREEGGLGIGLSVVRRLVEMHGGSVQAQSEGVNRGSEFIVRLPLLMEAVESREAPEQHPAELPFAEPRRILVVDDNRDAGETLSMLVQSLGHETRLAEDGLGALRLCAEWRPDLVFLDIGLPGMDGFEIAREIRLRNRQHVPLLVAVTGYGQERDRRKTREAGFDEHLVKPADFGQIATLLQELQRPETGGRAGSASTAGGA